MEWQKRAVLTKTDSVTTWRAVKIHTSSHGYHHKIKVQAMHLQYVTFIELVMNYCMGIDTSMLNNGVDTLINIHT